MVAFRRYVAVWALILNASASLSPQVWGADQPAAKRLGPTRCADCHNTPNPLRKRDFVLQTESATFIARDKHVQAFELLQGPLGQAMCERLGIADVTQAQQCLSCHAGWNKGEAPPPDLQFGVTCESCHGPSSLWDTPHSDPAWRLKSPQDKAVLGMTDVRHPVTRAEQCFSCHIGNAEHGKVLTHEMYAAGHPPLPGIEIESFIDQMPAHWRTLSEKGNFDSRAEYIQLNYPELLDQQEPDHPRARGTIVGGLVALRESLELFASQAQPDNPAWPELALFDCQACHHDLRAPSWRQQRGHSFAPGRPSLPEWPLALVDGGLRHLAGDDPARLAQLQQEFNNQRSQLMAAVLKRPFGDKNAPARARELAQWLEPHIQSLSTAHYDLPSVRRLQHQLTTLGPHEFPDFHTARQRVWALGVLRIEQQLLASAEPPSTLPGNTAAERRRQDAEHAARFERLQARRQDHLKKWASHWTRVEPRFALPLLLPAGQDQVIEQELPAALTAIADYDATLFRRLLKDYSETLGDLPSISTK